MFELNPGSREAHEKYGCICPMGKNKYGHWQPIGGWIINNSCPMHGTIYGKKYANESESDKKILKFLDRFQTATLEGVGRGTPLDSREFIDEFKKLGGQYAEHEHDKLGAGDDNGNGNTGKPGTFHEVLRHYEARRKKRN